VADAARLVALRVLGRVEEGGAYADRALAAEATRARLDGRDRAFAARLAFGAVQRRRTLDHVIAELGGREPAGLEPAVRDTLRLGAYQLLFADAVPPHAAVATSVDLVRAGGRAAAAGRVNAVLRRVADGGAGLLAALPDGTATEAALRRSYPDWIAELWFGAYGATNARALMDAGNRAAEVALRVRTGAQERVVAELAAAGVGWHEDPAVPTAIVLDGPIDVAATAAFRAGDAVPMSRASQRIAPLLAPTPGLRVLDACAAPGGKSGQLADLLGGGGAGLVCVEQDPKRCDALRDALRRQGAGAAEVVCADAAEAGPRLGPFDAILLDAPCTGLGVLAGRPDLRWRRTPDDVGQLAALQARLLAALLEALRPDGRLVYAVCTLSPAESDAITAPYAVREELRTWPHRGDGDGFYAAVLG
jgi:16S rRNA (cytosine967-C5)-methyltransferase